MDVRNCRRCGTIFNYVTGVPICPACREEEEKKFQIVKKFVQDNVQAQIPEIVERCEVSQNQIHIWIRQERLVFAENSPIGIDCEGCGAMIKTGRLCERCKSDLARGLNNSVKKQPVEPAAPNKKWADNHKMRFLDK